MLVAAIAGFGIPWFEAVESLQQMSTTSPDGRLTAKWKQIHQLELGHIAPSTL
jgi:hypothetical protein